MLLETVLKIDFLLQGMTPKENASTKAESIRNEEDTEEEGDSTDVEIQLAPTANRKLPTKAKNLNTGKLV